MNNANTFLDKLQQGKTCLGTGISLADPVVSEALAGDLDFFWIDMEHAPLTVADVRGHLMAMKESDCASLVRVPWNDPVLMKPVLDIGADGIIVPMAQNADDVARAVAACRYPPEGIRGFGPLRPLDYGRRDVAEYCREANENILTIVQIEQASAVDNIDEILAVPGLSSIAFGPNDLAASLGHRADTQHPNVIAAMQKVTDRARAANIPVGISIGSNPAQVCQFVDMGVQWIAMGLDVMLMRQAATEVSAKVREHIAGR